MPAINDHWLFFFQEIIPADISSQEQTALSADSDDEENDSRALRFSGERPTDLRARVPILPPPKTETSMKCFHISILSDF